MNDRRAGDDDDNEAPPPVAALLPPPGAGGGAAEAAAVADADAEANGQPDDPGGAPPGHGRGGVERRVVANSWVSIYACGFRVAVRALEDVDDRSPIDDLIVNDRVPEEEEAQVEDDAVDIEGDDALSFARFVTLLGQREGGRAVRGIAFLNDWGGLPEPDLERLFRDVLPVHRTLIVIEVNLSQLSPRFLRMLTENVTTAGQYSLSKLNIHGEEINPADLAEVVQAIVDMLNRNAAIEELRASLDLDAHQCKLICQASHRSTNLRYLYLIVSNVDSLDGLATSSLQRLGVNGSFSDAAVSSLARQLRTNETLQHLLLYGDDHGGNGSRDTQELLDLAKTYNFTLRTIGGNRGSNHVDAQVREQLQVFMRRNDRVRKLLHELQNPYTAQSRRVVPRVLLPSLLGPVSDLPTALYRILRMGNVHTVSNCLAAQGNDDGPRRSRRRRLR